MFSRKTRNLTVAVLALVMALTLSFGLFGFNTQANAVTETTNADNTVTTTFDFDTAEQSEWTLSNATVLSFEKSYGSKVNMDPYAGDGALFLTQNGYTANTWYYATTSRKLGVVSSFKMASNFTDKGKAKIKITISESGSFTDEIELLPESVSSAVQNSATNKAWKGADKTISAPTNQGGYLRVYLMATNTSNYVGIDDLTVVAQPAVIQYKVTYNYNDGVTANSTETYTKGGTALTLPTPNDRTGYTFDGWYNGATKVGNAGASYEPTANVELTAQWTGNTYDVTLDGTTTVKATYGQPLPTVTAPTKEDGSIFTGYYDAEGNQYYYDNGTSAVEAYTLTTGLALTSKWISPDMKFTATWKWNVEDATAELTLTSEDGLTVVTPGNDENTYEKVVTLAPTCTTVGSQNVTVKRTYLGTEYTDNQTLEMAALGHKMTAVAAVAPTCEAAGNNAYYYCENCKLYFKDEAGNTATTVESEAIAALGHKYNNAIWKWEGYESATATFACTNTCGHNEIVNATITTTNPTPTCDKFYGTQYTATATLEDGTTDTDVKNSPLQKHTVDENGICTVCGAYSVIFDTTGNTSQHTSKSELTWQFPANWELVELSDTKACDGDRATIPAALTAGNEDVKVAPIALGNKGTAPGKMTYTLPADAKNYITKVVVYAGACSGSEVSGVNVTVGDKACEKQEVATGKTIAAYEFVVNQKSAAVTVENTATTAKLYVYAVDIYYADYAVTVVDGDAQNVAYVNGAEYTFPAQAGLADYTALGWTDGTNLYKAGDKVTLTADMTVTALYAKLAFLGGSIRKEGITGVRYMFELEFYNITDANAMAKVGTTISGQYTLQTSQANTADLTGYKVNGNKIAMNAVIINKLDSTTSETDKALCTMNIVATLKITIAGTEISLTAEGISMATIAGEALGKGEIDLTLAQKYGYVAPAQA